MWTTLHRRLLSADTGNPKEVDSIRPRGLLGPLTIPGRQEDMNLGPTNENVSRPWRTDLITRHASGYPYPSRHATRILMLPPFSTTCQECVPGAEHVVSC